MTDTNTPRPWYDATHAHARPTEYLPDHRSALLTAYAESVRVTNVGAVVLVNSLNQILVGFNKKRRVWDVPQGVTEVIDGYEEAPVEAAVRELKEEVGIDIHPAALIKVAEIRHVTPEFSLPFVNHIYTNAPGLHNDFTAAQNLEPEKCSDLYWSAPCQLPTPRGLSLRTYLAIAGLSS